MLAPLAVRRQVGQGTVGPLESDDCQRSVSAGMGAVPPLHHAERRRADAMNNLIGILLEAFVKESGSVKIKVAARCAKNVPSSDWVCRNCAVVCLGSGLASWQALQVIDY